MKIYYKKYYMKCKEVIVLKMAEKFNIAFIEKTQYFGMWTAIQKERNSLLGSIEQGMKKLRAEHCMNRKKHSGVLYVYVLVVMLMVVTLSLITASLFDANLAGAASQRDDLQLYYYSKAGADWAVDLINTNKEGLDITGGSGRSLLEEIKTMSYSVGGSTPVWTGASDLVVGGEKVGHFEVEVYKLKRKVNKNNELDPSGTIEREYARVISTGSYAVGTKVSKETYTMTVLVPLEAPTEILYLVGRK